MSNKQKVLARLKTLQIPYEFYEHASTSTMEACQSLPFMAADITFCKNILLCNRQQTTYYLYVLPAEKPFRTSVFSKQVGSTRLSFAPEDALGELLELERGSLSPLGLWFDRKQRVQPVFDQAVRRAGRIAFHPCDNSATCVFQQEVFWQRVLPTLEHEIQWV